MLWVSHSVMSDSETPWTVTCQAPLSIAFSRLEYWSGLPCPSPGDLPDTGIETWSPALQADSLLTEPPGKPIIPEGCWANTYNNRDICNTSASYILKMCPKF